MMVLLMPRRYLNMLMCSTAGANIITQILNNNTFTGMTAASKITVLTENITSDTIWKKWPAPYIITGKLYVYKDSSTAATFTIEPGATLKFGVSGGLQIGSQPYKAALIAKGTAGNRITLTRDGTTGNWTGLTLDGATVATTIMEYTDVQFASSFTLASVSPVLRNSTLTDLASYASLYSSNATTTTFIFDQQGQLIEEIAQDGSRTDYIYLNGQPLAKIDSTGTSYIHTDHLGTPTMMTDGTAAKIWEIESRPFGDNATVSGTATLNIRFPGQYADVESGLNYNYYRDYNPSVGRYLEADPIGITQGENHLFGYVQNSPVRFIDPKGLSTTDPNDPQSCVDQKQKDEAKCCKHWLNIKKQIECRHKAYLKSVACLAKLVSN